MATRNDRVQLAAAVAALGIFIVTAACSDSTADKVEEVNKESSLYAVMYEVFSADSDESSSYLNVFDSLDIKEIDSQGGREFAGGRAFLQSYNNWVFIGEPSSPTILRFSLGDDGELNEDGTLSLGNYGLEDAAIDDWGSTASAPPRRTSSRSKKA